MPQLTARHLLFVYGTLKRGYTNWQRYLGIAESHGAAHFVGSAETVEAFPMAVRPEGVAPTTRAPVLMDVPGTGARICGEVFRVDDRCLEAMDILEGVRSGSYFKRTVEVTMLDEQPPLARHGNPDTGWLSGQTLRCTAYFFAATEELLSLPRHRTYSDALHLLYSPGPLNAEILGLCNPAAAAAAAAAAGGPPQHSLATSEAVPMGTHVLRLLPGDDLAGSLRTFAADRGILAAVVLSCVGSTGPCTMLRPAGAGEARRLDGDFEILSLTGTLSATGHHLHMSISDRDCHTYGGHVLEGCLVRTTAEVVVGVLEGVAFNRPIDVRTGFKELSVDVIN